MSSKERWIEEGMRVLADGGISAVTVDGIAGRLGLTKGSFHHHFHGIADYRGHLLKRFEADSVAAIESAAREGGERAPESMLIALPANVAFDRRIESAVRGWAHQDARARDVLVRVDHARLAALTELWSGIVDDPARAESAAMVPYLIAIGASVAHPPPSERAIADVFALLAALVPRVRELGAGE